MGQLVQGPWRHDPLLSDVRLAAWFGVSRKTIKRYVKAGMPCEDGRYRLSACERWRREREQQKEAV